MFRSHTPVSEHRAIALWTIPPLRRRAKSRWPCGLLLGVAIVCLSGCPNDNPTAPTPPRLPVPPEVLTNVVAYFEQKKSWKLAKSQMDRHKAFFVRRRAEFLGGDPATPTWIIEADQPTLKARIDNEYTQLDAALNAKAKAVDPTGGVDPITPPHLDLRDLAKATTTTSAGTVGSKAGKAIERRGYRVRAIGWRAAGIHDTLWQAAVGATTATLSNLGLNELIDRRLHMIERMNYQISRADELGGSWAFSGGGAAGPWTDGFRVRMFEYPRIPANVVGQVAGFVGNANIGADTIQAFQTGGPLWRWELGHRRLYFNVPPWPGLRFSTRAASDWPPDADTYIRNLTPATSAAAAIDSLFTPDPDWWGRSWLFCDHVLSALHIESLLFGLRRRTQPPSDAAFNAVVADNASGYVALGAWIGGSKPTRMLTNPSDAHFDQSLIDERDLQMGDHLIFWNSFVYSEISAGEWRLENSMVIDIDSVPKTGGIQRDKLRLQGHGTSEKIYARYQQEDIADQLNLSLAQVRNAIAAALAANPATTSIAWNGAAGRLVRWEPYEPFSAPGAWWAQISLFENGTIRWGTVTEALAAVLGAVATDPAPGAGYTPPPSANAVFFPIYRPAMTDGWTGYFNARRANAAFRAPKNLVAFQADGSIMPGLFFRGQGQPIPVIRPKVSP
jgi:hypothetical protein